MQEEKSNPSEFDASRSDYAIHYLPKVFPKNPLLTAVLYTIISFGGTVLLTLAGEGSAGSDAQDHTSLFKDYSSIINYVVVLPIGVILVLNFYNRVNRGFLQLIEDHVILFESEPERQTFLSEIDRSVNRKSLFYLSIIIVFLTYVPLASYREGYWNSGFGGPNVWWFRIFSTLNLYVITHVLLKSIFVAQAMRRCFKNEVLLQPLHPDGCGGLRSLGDISLSINSLVGIVAVYLSVIAFSDFSPLQNPIFFVVVICYGLIATYLFFVPLAGAHDLMDRKKSEVLHALNREFQSTYVKVSASQFSEGISLQDAQKIESLERLYRIASRMPVWPIDTRIIGQFVAVVAIPLIIGLVIESLKYFYFPA